MFILNHYTTKIFPEKACGMDFTGEGRSFFEYTGTDAP